MKNHTPFLKGFGPLLFGKAPRRAVEKLRALQSLEDLSSTFGYLLDERFWQRDPSGPNSRSRLLPASVTFWAFVSQVLSPGSSCREVVKKVEAWWRWANWRSSNTVSATAYCQARQRLSLNTLELINDSIALRIQKQVLSADHWIKGRAVKIVDGTMLSMPDEPSLQLRWPQHSGQAPGCGFPLLNLVGVFSLSSGALLASATGNKHDSESVLFKSLWKKLQRGDIVLEDRGFCSYGAISSLLQRGIDTVSRLHKARAHDLSSGEVLGEGDRLISWQKPLVRPTTYNEQEWALVPPSLSLRQIEITIETKGFRTQHVTVVTTLCDHQDYPAERIRALYAERWQVEMHFAQLKTILGMDVLRCKSPEMIEKELQIHLIAYNLVRALMQRSANIHHVRVQRISFKGALDTVRHYAPIIHQAGGTLTRQRELVAELLAHLANDLIPERPNRSEPRAIKRRPKNFHKLSRPRREMGNLPHKNRKKKNVELAS